MVSLYLIDLVGSGCDDNNKGFILIATADVPPIQSPQEVELAFSSGLNSPLLALRICGSRGNTDFSGVTPEYTRSHRSFSASGVFQAFSGSLSQSRIK